MLRTFIILVLVAIIVGAVSFGIASMSLSNGDTGMLVIGVIALLGSVLAMRRASHPRGENRSARSL